MHTHLLSSKVAENTCHIFSDVKMQRNSSHFYISFCATSEYLQQSICFKRRKLYKVVNLDYEFPMPFPG